MKKKRVDEITETLVRETEIILSDQTNKITSVATLSDMGFDSMSFVELLVSIEREFNVQLIEIGIQHKDMKTLNELAHYICRIT